MMSKKLGDMMLDSNNRKVNFDFNQLQLRFDTDEA